MQIPCESIPVVLWKTLSWRSDPGTQVTGWESECPSSACQLGFSATLSSVESQEAHPLRCRWRPPGSLEEVCGFVSKHFLLRSQDRKLNSQGFAGQNPFSGDTKRTLGDGLGPSTIWTGGKVCPLWRSPQPSKWASGKCTPQSHLGLGRLPVKKMDPPLSVTQEQGKSGLGPEEGRTGSLWTPESTAL